MRFLWFTAGFLLGEWDWYCRQHSPTGIRCSNVAVLRERCPRVERYYYRRGTSAA